MILSANTHLHVCDAILWHLFCDAQMFQIFYQILDSRNKKGRIGVLQTPKINDFATDSFLSFYI